MIEAGVMTIRVPLDKLRPQRDNRRERRKKYALERPSDSATTTRRLTSKKRMEASAELMLLGKRVDEALSAIDQFLDDAVLNSLSPVRIVHGKGTGALRSATQAFLSRDPRVRRFRLGGDGEGGDGVTIAELS